VSFISGTEEGRQSENCRGMSVRLSTNFNKVEGRPMFSLSRSIFSGQYSTEVGFNV